MARLSTAAWLTWIAAVTCASAQENAPDPDPDLIQPPTIEGEPAPGAPRLEPADEDREDMLEAVVKGGQTDFRLPDLGTSFREEEQEDPNDRIDMKFLYLYDPDNQDPAEAIFPTIEDLRRVGFLHIFEMRFGHRSRE
jgi:hypothetical protein